MEPIYIKVEPISSNESNIPDKLNFSMYDESFNEIEDDYNNLNNTLCFLFCTTLIKLIETDNIIQEKIWTTINAVFDIIREKTEE